MAHKQAIKESTGDRVFLVINYAIMAFIIVACIYPLYYCLVLSFNEGKDAMKGFIYFWPRKFTLENYKLIFRDSMILDAYVVTIARTVVGTIATVVFNAIFGYALSRKELWGRKIYITLGMITMFFWGGTIPLYMLVRELGLIDSFLVYILLPLSGFYTILIYMSFYAEIPSALLEAAKIDGANEWTIFIRIVLPISTAVMATIALFSGVGHWNSWLESYLYINSSKLHTMPYILVKMINQGMAEERLRASGQMMAFSSSSTTSVTGNSVRLATMLVAVAPIMVIYPFLQKYFVKGLLIGSVKE